jgi:cytoskeletal protein RodZ
MFRTWRTSAGVGALTAILVTASAGAAFSQEHQATSAAPAAAAGDLAAAGDPAGAERAAAAMAAPPELVPPAGNVLNSVFAARGVQVYECRATAWSLLEPAATLVGSTVRPFRPASAVHFRGPSWQSAEDGSLVEAKPFANVPSPGTIPQLLVQAKLNRGAGIFGQVTFIQRLATSGGVAPAGSCTDGATVAVPYRAVYRFFVAAKP